MTSSEHHDHAGRAAARELREAMARRQVTLAALSEATGISRSTLERKLSGGDSDSDSDGDLTVTELVRLAIALDVPAADLIAAVQRRQ